jgi:hypothetical protein
MVKERNNKHAFWMALVFTVAVFGVGLIFGIFLEGSRVDKVQAILADSEINILDDELRNKVLEDFNISCVLAVDNAFNFADKIYFEASKLEQYDAASKFENSLLILHRRYDLLRTLLWSDTIGLKERCAEESKNVHTVVYLYQYDIEDIDIDSKQLFYSRLLFDLKLKYPREVLLIPIAVNTNLSSVDIIMDSYDFEEFPKVIIDEEKVIDEVITFEELEKIVFESN